MAPTSWSHHRHFLLLSGNSHEFLRKKKYPISLEYQEIPSRGAWLGVSWGWFTNNNGEMGIIANSAVIAIFMRISQNYCWWVLLLWPVEPWGTSHVDDQASTGPGDLDNENSDCNATKGWTRLLSTRPVLTLEGTSERAASTGSCLATARTHIGGFLRLVKLGQRSSVWPLPLPLPLTFTPTHHRPSYPCGRLHTA